MVRASADFFGCCLASSVRLSPTSERTGFASRCRLRVPARVLRLCCPRAATSRRPSPVPLSSFQGARPGSTFRPAGIGLLVPVGRLVKEILESDLRGFARSGEPGAAKPATGAAWCSEPATFAWDYPLERRPGAGSSLFVPGSPLKAGGECTGSGGWSRGIQGSHLRFSGRGFYGRLMPSRRTRVSSAPLGGGRVGENSSGIGPRSRPIARVSTRDLAVAAAGGRGKLGPPYDPGHAGHV